MEFIDKNRKWFGLGSCILILISLFIPFAKVSAYGYSASVSLIEGLDGKLLILPIGAAIGLFMAKKEKFSLIPLGITLIVVLIDLISAKSKISNSIYSSSIELTIMVGTYVMILGIIIAAVFALLPGSKKDNTSQVATQPVVEPTTPVQSAPNVVPTVEPMMQPTIDQNVQPATQPVVESTTPVQPASNVAPIVEPMMQPTMTQDVQPVASSEPSVAPIEPTVQPVIEPTMQRAMAQDAQPVVSLQQTQPVENQPGTTPLDNNQQNVQ